ncbi:MAG: TonB-dependent receptor [Flavipsychrobacter sp.]|nr:TonB-dependent receptor [Flavipsychrobacter sp.]
MQRITRANKHILLFLLFIALPALAFAQKKVTLSGYVKDAETGETLIGATIHIKELSQTSTTNAYGFYSISAPASNYTVIFAYGGYITRVDTLALVTDMQYDAQMNNQVQLAEVEVYARGNDNVKNTEMGTVSLSVDKIKNLPVILGESDILKAIQLLPGVMAAGEANSGFYVRGGGPDQNLVLLDDAVVYNTGHLFGFFSVFNSDALKNVTLIKGGMPANYGGRLSSVVDVSMKDGNMKEYHAEGGIGLIASRLTLEGPIKKDKGSFMLSGRRTYLDVVLKPFVKGALSNSGYFFYDANLKANYNITDKDRIYLSGYLGLDKFRFQGESGNFSAEIPWGNNTATLRWNHLFSNKIFTNTTVVYNDYDFASSFKAQQATFKLSSGVRDWNIKSDLDYYTTFNHHIKAGVNYTYHKFIPNQISGSLNDSVELNPDNALIKYAHEAGAYIMDDFDVNKWLRINAGVRYSWFGQIGPYTDYVYDYRNQRIDSTIYGSGQLIQNYGGLEPRVNARIQFNDASSVKASVAKSYQYIHLLSNNGSTLPTDIWVPSTLRVRPQQAWQYSLGYFRNFLDDKVEASVEVYYKDMKNQVEYRQGYLPSSLTDPELDYVYGTGEAYGSEFFINKTRGKFTGWIGYTLAWTTRQFPDLNGGKRYPAKYDRRHDLSLVGSYELSKKWVFSGVFIYATGNAITLPSNLYFIESSLVQQFSELNAYRVFAYHRLDLSVIYKPQRKKPKKRKWEGSWAFSIYNVYSRQNPYFIYLDTEGDVNTGIDVKVKQVSIFPIIPSITYNFKF